MKEKEFLRELNLIRESKEVNIDVSQFMVEKIDHEEQIFIWKFTVLFFPVSVLGLLFSTWILLKLHVLKAIMSFSFIIPQFFYNTPFISFFIYILSAGFILSILFAVLVKGGKGNEVLLSSG